MSVDFRRLSLKELVCAILRDKRRLLCGITPYMIPNPRGDEVIYGISDYDYVALSEYTCCALTSEDQLVEVAKATLRSLVEEDRRN